MTTRILFVCLGNICRSPTAEGVFRAMRPGHPCDSAGTSDWHVGAAPYAPMQAAALARGYDLSDLRARQITQADFAAFDLILGMDPKNLAAVEALRPQGSATRVEALTAFAGPGAPAAVPDPYYTRDFDGALGLIEQAVRGLATHLGRQT